MTCLEEALNKKVEKNLLKRDFKKSSDKRISIEE